MSYNPVNSNGQTTSANSAPVVIASDQSSLSVAISDSTYNALDSTSGALNTYLTNPTIPTTFGINGPGSASWTSATSLNTASTLSPVSGQGTILVDFVSSGTITGGVITFEAFDNTNWWPLPILQTSSYVLQSTYTLTGSNQAWQGNVSGFTQFRVRLSTVISGSGTAKIIIASMAGANPTNVVVGQPTAANLQATVTQASGDWNSNIAQVGGSSLALGNAAQSASIPVTIASNDATTNSIAASGATYPANIMAVGAKNTGNIVGLTADAGNRLEVNVATAISAGTNAIGTIGTTSGAVNVGQTTSGTSAVQLSSTSTVPTNGIIVEALVGNTAVVYIGGSGVTTSTGFQLSPGQSMSFSANLNTLYVVGSNTSDKVCWNVV